MIKVYYISYLVLFYGTTQSSMEFWLLLAVFKQLPTNLLSFLVDFLLRHSQSFR